MISGDDLNEKPSNAYCLNYGDIDTNSDNIYAIKDLQVSTNYEEQNPYLLNTALSMNDIKNTVAKTAEKVKKKSLETAEDLKNKVAKTAKKAADGAKEVAKSMEEELLQGS